MVLDVPTAGTIRLGQCEAGINVLYMVSLFYSFKFVLQIVERHVVQLQDGVDFDQLSHRSAFFNLLRTAAYGALDLNVQVRIFGNK